MKKIKLKQGTLAWEKVRDTRIGSSEVFDIVRYYATDTELQNCGINAEDFRREKPYTTVWALYHKMLKDGIYRREALEPENAEYGHAVEPYGVHKLQTGRAYKVKPGEVYIDDRLIVSLDVAGVAEEIDVRPFDFGIGQPKVGQRFVCEQKSMRPQVVKNGFPFKYIIQAQHQITRTKADFYILQIMILDNDTVFNRGKICQMSRRKRFQFLDAHMEIGHYYFQNNEHLARLIEECIDRFFFDVEIQMEPMAFIECDSQQNIIESIRQNVFFNNDFVCDLDLSAYADAKQVEDHATERRKAELQKVVDVAKEYNVCRFRSSDGTTAYFDKRGRFQLKKPEEKE